MDKIAILIPCYNEENTIAKVVGDFLAILPEASVYVFDNASEDNTAKEARDAGAKVFNVPQRGKGNVVRSMFASIDAETYLLVDGDGTYLAKDAKKLLEKAQEGYDMVIGDRFAHGAYYTDQSTYVRSFGNVLVRALIRIFFRYALNDVLSGYRAISRRFVHNCNIRSDGFDVETEMTICAIVKQYRICQIPIDYQDRPEGSSSKIRVLRDGYIIIMRLLQCYGRYLARNKNGCD